MLSDEQLEVAQSKISEKIDGEIELLLTKWNPVLEKYNKSCYIEIVVNEQDKVDTAEKIDDSFFSEHFDNEQLGTVAQELDKISQGMTEDLTSAITNCNQLLSRYGMACDMAFAEKVK